MAYEYPDYLAHHGVIGMRWGFRKDKYKKMAERSKKRPESATWKSREASGLSNEELDRRNQRLQKENQYKQNVENAHPVRKGIKDAAKKILVGSAVAALSGIMVAKYKDGASFLGKLANYKLPTNAVRAAQAAKAAQEATAAAKRAEELARYAGSLKR